jgi:hypothetical protein
MEVADTPVLRILGAKSAIAEGTSRRDSQKCSPYFTNVRLILVRATPLMIVPWLIFIAVGLITYAGFVKLAARLLRYKVSWMSSFLFAVIVLVLVIFDHVLAFDQPVAIRIVHVVVLLLVLVIWVAGFSAPAA